MTEALAAERPLILSQLPAGPRERRLALAVVLVSILVFLAAAPFARLALPRLDAFIPAYESALVINDLITAALLFGQFAIARQNALLALASGYLFTALMAVAHALSFPGLFAPGGLLGAGPQSTAWIYMLWHAGFPVAALAYAWFGGSIRQGRTVVAILLAVLAVLAAVTGLTALATVGSGLLPEIMAGNGYTPTMIFVVASVWLLSLLALGILVLRRPYSVLDLCLIAALCAWLCDIALSAVLNAGRFDLGFYAGRIYGLLAASVVLAALLLETVSLYARLARSLAAEREERERRLGELRSELIHVSRLTELGQMVSALAHEVNQPLTAIANYLRACQRRLQSGETAKTQTALDKAIGEATRARDIVQRLRDFIKKNESETRAEDLRAAIEEILSLALLGAEGRAVEAQLRFDGEVSMAVIDKVQIQQVLLNLVRNAIEAMADLPRRRLVIAAVPAAGDKIEISVADSGPGLSAAVREKLFQPFVTTKSTGMGVGLSICRSIVEAHEGRLWAEDNPGGGTVFRFTVPRAPDQPGESAAA